MTILNHNAALITPHTHTNTHTAASTGSAAPGATIGKWERGAERGGGIDQHTSLLLGNGTH